MVWLVHFGLGMLLSFIGSIPFGTINVATADTAIRHGFRSAVWVALGAALIEFIQAVCSLRFSEYLMTYPVIETALNWASIPILIGLGVYFLTAQPAQKQTSSTNARGFLKGVIVSALNVLAIPYWIFYGSYLSSNGIVNLGSNACILVFGVGVVIGTFLILLVYARLGIIASEKSSRVRDLTGKIVAAIFFILALVQLIRILA